MRTWSRKQSDSHRPADDVGVKADPLSHRILVRVGIALTGALLLGLCTAFILVSRGGAVSPKQTDFVAYYSGARLVLSGHASQIYDLQALGRYEQHLVAPLQMKNGVLPYVYPTYFAVLQAPLAALPYNAAYFLWLVLSSALLLATIAAYDRLLSLRGNQRVLLWLAALSFLPTFIAIIQGQSSVLILALVTGAFLAARAKRDGLCGCLLALALVKPPLVIAFLVVLLVRRRWRAIVTFTGTGVTLLAIPALVFGSGTLSGYAGMLRQATTWRQQFGYGPALNHSFAGFSQLLLPQTESRVLTLTLITIALAVVAWQAHWRQTEEIPFAAAGVAAILISPHVLVHDMVLLLFPVAIALRYASGRELSLAVVLVLGSIAILTGFRLAYVAPLQLSVLAISALGGWLCWPISHRALATSSSNPTAFALTSSRLSILEE